jgi:hypothetical protein
MIPHPKKAEALVVGCLISEQLDHQAKGSTREALELIAAQLLSDF